MPPHHETNPSVALTKYFIQFSAIYVLCTLIVVLATSLLDFDVPSAMGIIVLLAAVSSPIKSFVNDQKRVFTLGERLRFSTGIAFASLVLNVAFAGLFVYIASAYFGERNPLIDVIHEAKLQGFTSTQVLGLVALLWWCVSWIIAYLFAWFSAKSWHRKLSSAQ